MALRLARPCALECLPTYEPTDGTAVNESLLVAEHGLKEADIGRLISPWHTDADLGRPIEVVTDMSKSRAMGFTAYQASDQAFFDVFDKLREMRLIP